MPINSFDHTKVQHGIVPSTPDKHRAAAIRLHNGPAPGERVPHRPVHREPPAGAGTIHHASGGTPQHPKNPAKILGKGDKMSDQTFPAPAGQLQHPVIVPLVAQPKGIGNPRHTFPGYVPAPNPVGPLKPAILTDPNAPPPPVQAARPIAGSFIISIAQDKTFMPHGYAAIHANAENDMVSLMRLDGANWDNTIAGYNWYLQDISICRTIQGNDFIIGVDSARANVYMVWLHNGNWLDLGVHDGNNTLSHPTLYGYDENTAHGTLLLGCCGQYNGDGVFNIPQIWTCQLDGTGYNSTEGWYVCNYTGGGAVWTYVWNASLAPDGTWWLGSGIGSSWPGSAYDGQQHYEIICANTAGQFGQNSYWLTAPWFNYALTDADEASIGQWSPTYGSRYFTYKAMEFCNLPQPKNFYNPGTYNCDIAVGQCIWEPDGSGTGTTQHVAGSIVYCGVNPQYPGFWTGSPALQYPSHAKEDAGDMLWVTYNFYNPWGIGYANSFIDPNIRAENNPYYQTVGFAAESYSTREDVTKGGPSAAVCLMNGYANWLPSWVDTSVSY